MRHSVYDSYQEAEILSANPLHLVCLLYRGAIEAIVKARESLAARDIAGRSRAVNKALRILSELIFTLDHKQGTTVSKPLVELYVYIQRLLIDANCRQVDTPLSEALTLMTTLQEAWEICEVAEPAAQGIHQGESEYAPISCAG
jgi:flagellar secretion chaperone FliS